MTRANHPWGPFDTPFEAVGGEGKLRSIVDRFYDIIDAEASTLRAMLPKDDSASRDKLYWYLVEWSGGPALYSPERGHPAMRMRHLPFEIGADEVDTWLTCFGRALDDNDVTGQVRDFLDERIGALALHMQNQP
ncbi:MAG: group II truncated hemoglobin [Actinomycetota bacterium]|nr:group II truncated hemoglobin [Actinomycetota bacterium]MDK1016614.1 group II truncated hemoglobin [Actinomycetota bacterium]MDK1026299.1 group II truncated hemoglobin [Actinomycetota bacterium]MDK1037323.1 group II truncated hemoglobin [Actinomycetota bacterium]MDK1096198.1 group II truncated hemoglobin [Actinomycetota bacterium]